MAPTYLEHARKEVKELSQEELGRAAGVSRSLIAHYETGVKVLTLGSAARLYAVLETLGSVAAINALRAIAELSKTVSLMTLPMIASEREHLDANDAAARVYLAEHDAEILRLDQKLATVVQKRGWGNA